MAEGRWKIYWNGYASYTYLYGSTVEFIGRDNVRFENELMPPGTVIKEWFSKTNFQGNHIEPTLPLIDGEGSYSFEAFIDCKTDEQFLFKMIFFDRFDNETGSIHIWDRKTVFRCPMNTFSYKLQLINGGMTGFSFHYLVIQEINDETDET